MRGVFIPLVFVVPSPFLSSSLWFYFHLLLLFLWDLVRFLFFFPLFSVSLPNCTLSAVTIFRYLLFELHLVDDFKGANVFKHSLELAAIRIPLISNLFNRIRFQYFLDVL